jgi:hypothetical protein
MGIAATGIHFQTTSDSNGFFTFPVLPVGTYTIEVEHLGFAKLTQKNITLSVGARLNLNLSLSVAGQTQSVTARKRKNPAPSGSRSPSR